MTDKPKEATLQEISDIGQEIEMNIKELAEQAGLGTTSNDAWYPLPIGLIHLVRFAELVAAAEREQCAKHYLGIMRDAVEQAVLREREACAKVCESPIATEFGKGIAAAIRGRQA